MSEDPIVSYYQGEQPDTHGRFIKDVWAFDPSRLQDAPHYIEWLFPLDTVSKHAPDAPLVTAHTRHAFAHDVGLRGSLKRSLDLMLDYYGLRREGNAVSRSKDFESRRLGWLYPGDQGHRRLSRITKSLALLAETDLAVSLRDQLVSIADEYGAHSVSAETRGRWVHLLDE